MKLAILDAVPLKFVHVDQNRTDGSKFVHLLTDAGFMGEMVCYNITNDEFPQSIDEYDAFLVTGSPSSVYEDHAWIETLLTFIRAVDAKKKPLVGICFGHQAIAQALGGQVKKNDDGWLLGLESFQVTDAPSWMEPAVETCQIYHINQDQVINLPPNAHHIGYSAQCPNSMYTIGDHIFSVQGHPEQYLSSMRNFIGELASVLDPDVIAHAEATFQAGEPDRLLVGRWICQFLTKDRKD